MSSRLVEKDVIRAHTHHLVVLVYLSFDEDRVRQHLEAEGHKPQPVIPLVPLQSIGGSSAANFSSVCNDANQSLTLLESEVAEIRENMKQVQKSLFRAGNLCSHPGVKAFYRDEVSAI